MGRALAELVDARGIVDIVIRTRRRTTTIAASTWRFRRAVRPPCRVESQPGDVQVVNDCVDGVLLLTGLPVADDEPCNLERDLDPTENRKRSVIAANANVFHAPRSCVKRMRVARHEYEVNMTRLEGGEE